MPRILPRLNAQIEKQANHPKFFPFPKPKRRKSLYRPLPPIPSFHPADYPSSILLATANPITDSWNYKRHKTLPPATTSQSLRDSSQTDNPREMTSEEFQWWSNPYLRMLASPLRQCIVTNRTLPSDFLIRLAAMRVPPSRISTSGGKGLLVPDGLLHSKYTHRKAGRASYILCWREAVLKLQMGSFKRISPHVTYSPRLPDYIAHLLRLRVLQEFELLAERLEYRMKTLKQAKAYSTVILRRLTRAEWGLLQSSGFIPYQNALAALILPPVNKDIVTRTRPKGSMSVALTEVNQIKPPTRPLSVLIPTSLSTNGELASQAVPSSVIPLYNGATAFPDRSQRSALYAILVRILVSERFVKKRLRGVGALPPRNEEENSSSKASHAFLLCSDEDTGKRGDVAGVARALWRLRMFEGEGWQYPDHSC